MRVALTRHPRGNRALRDELEAWGIDVVERPLIEIEPLDGPPVDAGAYDWLVVTSRNAAGLLGRRISGHLPRVAAIGRATADALRTHGIEPALVARESTQEGLLAELPRQPGRVLFAGAEGARDLLARQLHADVVPLYRTRELPVDDFPDADLVVLASASAARSLAAARRDLPCVSIGPVTSAEARALGLRVVAEARTHDREGLVEAVKLAASNTGSSRS